MELNQKEYMVKQLKLLAQDLGRNPMKHEFKEKFPRVNMDVIFGYDWDNALAAAGLLKKDEYTGPERRPPKILILDIETKPIKAWAWGIWDQNIPLEMIIEDWSVLAWAAKRLGEDHVYYRDLSHVKNGDYTNDREIVKEIFDLLNDSEVILTQNGTRFDIPKLNAKFEEYGYGTPKQYKHIDALKIVRRKFKLTSNKLEWMTNKFNEKYKKLKHEKYPGNKLWLECLAGNLEAWADMQTYNKMDVLALEELYREHLIRWDKSINFGVYLAESGVCTNCGSSDLENCGHVFTNAGAFKNFKCKNCGTHSSSKDNELRKAVRKGLLR